MFGPFKDLYAYRDLLLLLVGRNLKIRYKRSALGFFWSLLNPLFLIFVYAVFLKILKFYNPKDPLFLPMMVTGIIVWQFLSLCLGDSLYCVLGNANLVQKTSFPRIVLPLSMVFANLVNFLLSLLILIVYLLILGIMPGRLWALPAIILTQTALCLGLSLILACMNILFRDTEHLLGVIMLAWFFLTPIIYPLAQIPAQYQRLAFLNPMTGVVTAYRWVFLGTDLMAPRLVAMSLLIAWAVCLAGLGFFNWRQSRFVDDL